MGCGVSKTVPRRERTAADIIFDKFDRDGSGKINNKEFKHLCFSMGYNLTDQEVDINMKLLDLSGDGQIERKEFMKWWRQNNKFSQLHWNSERLKLLEAFTEKFKTYDKDNSNTIDHKEFKELHRGLLEENLTTLPLDLCIKELDSNNDGKIVFYEYVRFMVNKDQKDLQLKSTKKGVL
ncbi:hypothetical protein HDV01_002330 [Terramyces sp. JEL0728]|nr:hypothetical protein HDV01_002330 [Terramyces sp. JEL0728]